MYLKKVNYLPTQLLHILQQFNKKVIAMLKGISFIIILI